ncbi:MAG: ribonuclease P protein component [Flavipsychrobacter sp.]|nr:ribonuclease P protein component [Flavipsychrobacter sp.]
MRNTFKAYERLKREQHIETLFQHGKAFSVFPLRAIYHTVPRGEALSPVQVGFSVPKKRFRRAVDRHRVRRVMVEAWRLNKHPLYASLPAGIQLHLFLIFTDSSLPDFSAVETALLKITDRLTELLQAPDA